MITGDNNFRPLFLDDTGEDPRERSERVVIPEAERSGAGSVKLGTVKIDLSEAEPLRTEEVSTDLLPKLGPDGKPIYENFGDKYIKQLGPDKMRHTHATVAWMAAGGAKNADIAREIGETGLTPNYVSLILNTSSVKAKIKEIQKEHYGGSIDARFKLATGPAMDVIVNTITPNEENEKFVKPALRADTARWLLEKVTGKARQEVDIKGNLFGDLLGRLDEIRNQGKVIDVKALSVVSDEDGEGRRPEHDGAQSETEHEKWIRENLKVSGK